MEQPELKQSPMTLHSLARSYRLMAELLESKTDCVIPAYGSDTPTLRDHKIHMDCYGETVQTKFFPLLKSLGTFKKHFDNYNFMAALEVEGLQLLFAINREFVCKKVKVLKEVEVEQYDCDSLIDQMLKAEIPGLEIPEVDKAQVIAESGLAGAEAGSGS